MKLTCTCFVALSAMVLVTANNLADHELADRELSARARRMLQRPARACVNPACTSPPCAAKLLGDVGCTTVSGVAEYNHELVRRGETIAANAHIFGPFEAGFTERQKNIINGWGCLDPSVAYDSAGGKDIGLAERETAYKCNMEFPRFEGNRYIGVVGKCGGHTRDYHFHRSFSCLYKEKGGHSTAVGKIGEHRIYGKWEDYSKKLLPLLDACGGHWGPTPDCEWCYHYHVQDRAPFTVGCMGPAADGGLVSINTCRALYGKCGDATEMIAVGKDEAVKYDRFCPCYDADGSNVNTKELPALSTKAIAVHAETGEFFGGSTTAMSAGPTTTSVVNIVTSDCPKCGTNKNGKSSCCGRSGAWFGKCANKVDAKFDHTWVEGVMVCKGKEKNTTPVVNSVPSACTKCGTIKNGKSSCCGRGGAWFGKCANNVNAEFDHTWVEGLKECRSREPARGVGQAKPNKLDKTHTTGSYEQNVLRRTSTATVAGFFSDVDVDGYANSKVNAKLTNLVGLVTVLLAVALA